MATRLAMRTEVIYMIGDRPELNTNADNWVRRAYQHITQSVELPEAEVTAIRSTVISLRTVALPDDYFSMYSVRNITGDKRVRQVSVHEYDALSPATTGPCDRYNVVLRTLNIHPTPVAIESLQIRYRKVFADLGNDDDAHLLPDLWDECIVLLAAAFGFDHTNEIERSQYYKRQARNFIAAQQSRLAMDLYDRDEAITPIGLEI